MRPVVCPVLGELRLRAGWVLLHHPLPPLPGQGHGITENRAGKPWSFILGMNRRSFWASGDGWKKEACSLFSQTLDSVEAFCYSWNRRSTPSKQQMSDS